MTKIIMLVLAIMFVGCISTEPTTIDRELLPPIELIDHDQFDDPIVNGANALPEVDPDQTAASFVPDAEPVVRLFEEPTGSVTLADHAPGHVTTARVCPYLIVDNATVQLALARIRFPDGTERVVPTGDGRTPCTTVQAGGPYEVSLADGCGGRLVVPASGLYRETLRGGQRRAPRFECYVRIGGP